MCITSSIDPEVFYQNRHHLARSPGGDGFAPVVGFGVAQFVQGFDGELDGGEGAKYEMADGFTLRTRRIRNWGHVCARVDELSHETGLLGMWVQETRTQYLGSIPFCV